MPATGQGEDPAQALAAPAPLRNILETAKGTGFIVAGTFFEFGSRFVIALVLARVLGSTDYGLYVLAISAASLFAGISLLGLDDAMVRYVAIQSGRGDDPGVWGTLQIGLGVSTVIGTAMGIGLYLCAEPIAVGLFDEPELVPLLHLFAIVVPFLTVSNVLLGTTRGFGRMDYAAFAENVVQSIVRMILVVLLALLGTLNLFAAAVIFGLSDVAASVTLIILLHRLFGLKRPIRRGVRRDVKEIFRFAIPLWLSGVLRQFRRNIQNLMVGALSTVSSVGIYSIVNRVNLVANVSSSSIYVAVKPILARLHDRRDRPGLEHLYTTATRWTFALNMPFFLVMVLYPESILHVFGTAFTAGAAALVVLAFAQLANAGTGICQPMIDMTGHTRVKLANTVLWTVLLIGSGALLIPRWGVLGAASASLIAIASVNVAAVVEVWVLEHLIPYDRTFWKPTAATLAALALGFVMKAWMPVGDSLVPAMVQGTIVGLAYVGLLLVLRLEPEDRLVIQRTWRKVVTLARRIGFAGRPAEGAPR